MMETFVVKYLDFLWNKYIRSLFQLVLKMVNKRKIFGFENFRQKKKKKNT